MSLDKQELDQKFGITSGSSEDTNSSTETSSKKARFLALKKWCEMPTSVKEATKRVTNKTKW